MADEHIVGRSPQPAADGDIHLNDVGHQPRESAVHGRAGRDRACGLPIAEEFDERTQVIRQPDAEHHRVHEERITIRPIGGKTPTPPPRCSRATAVAGAGGRTPPGTMGRHRRLRTRGRRSGADSPLKRASSGRQPSARAMRLILAPSSLSPAPRRPAPPTMPTWPMRSSSRPPRPSRNKVPGPAWPSTSPSRGEQVSRLHLQQAPRYNRGRLGLIRTIGHHVRRLLARDAGPHRRYQ